MKDEFDDEYTELSREEQKARDILELKQSMKYPFLFVLFLWIIKIYSVKFGFDLIVYGLLPRTLIGLRGIFFTPFIHSDMEHLFSNSLPLFILGSGLFFLYRKVAWKVLLIVYLGGGLGAWLFARPFYHVGASGIVYGLVTFIFFYGIIRKEKQSIGFALIVTFLYGSMVWGVLPIVRGISWESHLSGAIAGLFSAIIYRKAYPPMISHSAAEDEEGQDEYFE